MKNKKHIVIYSHGFGVQKDDLGLLTDIAESISEIESVLFDYYEVDLTQNKIFICPISSQVNKLNQVIKDVKLKNPEAIIDLIAHSQGTMVAAMARNKSIRKSILLSSVFDMGLQRTLTRYNTKPGVKIDLEGISEIPSLSGSTLTKIIPKEYWQERLKIKVFDEYNELIKNTEVIAIEAKQDQLLPKVSMDDLNPGMRFISLDGDHNFNAPNREDLIKTIRDLLL